MSHCHRCWGRSRALALAMQSLHRGSWCRGSSAVFSWRTEPRSGQSSCLPPSLCSDLRGAATTCCALSRAPNTAPGLSAGARRQNNAAALHACHAYSQNVTNSKGCKDRVGPTPNSHTSSHLRRILPRPLHPRALSSVLRYFDLSRTAATSALNAPRFSTSVCVLRLTTSIILSLVCDKSGVRKW
jgi:hypothetical protein